MPVTRSVEEFLEPEKPSTLFNVQLAAKAPDKTSLGAYGSLMVYNRYYLDKKAGIIKPKLTYDYNAHRDGDKYLGAATIKSIEKGHVIFTKKLVQCVFRDGEQAASANPVVDWHSTSILST
jgi:hypothetical protein